MRVIVLTLGSGVFLRIRYA